MSHRSSPRLRSLARPASSRRHRALACSIAMLAGAVLMPQADAQTWGAAPATNDWNTAGNWTPANVPNTVGETAVFTTSTRLNPTNNAVITIGGITFNGPAAFAVQNTDSMTIAGAGITNTSGLTQTINNDGFVSQLVIENAATVGSQILITNTGFVTFDDTASAGSGTVTNVNLDGVINFIGNASAGNSTLNNNGTGAPNGSTILFSSNATAGTSTINNTGGNATVVFSGNALGGTAAIINSGTGAATQFSDNASAGGATITNQADTATIFNGSASAGTATINATGAFSAVTFENSATGANSTINLNANLAIGEFKNNSTAGDATINLLNPTALLNFFDATSAGTSEINNSAVGGTFPGAVVGFFNNSNAGTAVINNSGANAQTLFSAASSANGSTITNSGDDSNTTFVVSATGGTANISNSGIGSSTVFGQNASAGGATITSGGALSEVSFQDNSTGGNSTITLSGNVAIGEFKDSATAGNATINLTNNTALLNFFDNSTGGTARINNSASSGTFPAGVVGFFNSANAQNAQITNSGARSQTLFSATSNAGSAVIVNSGDDSNTTFVVNANAGTSTITNAGIGSSLQFAQNATAGAATIVSSGAVSLVSFTGSSTGGTSNITLSGNVAIGEFKDNSTAGDATINLTNNTALLNFFDATTGGTSEINNSASSGTFPAGVVGFFGTSNAQGAVIRNSGMNAQTLFSDTSSAGAAVIVNSGDDSNTQFIVSARAGTANITNSGAGSSVGFAQNSNAQNATIVSSGANSEVSFIGNSNAGSSNITLSGNLALGEFLDNASAGNATITLTNATSTLSFFDNTTAGSAILRNQGNGPAPASSVIGFFGRSNAQNAVITNSGTNSQTLFSGTSASNLATITNSGAGSSTVYSARATGGNTTIINANPTARIDISSLLNSSLTIGSFEGNGFLNLGGQTLTAGGNNRDITFSGTIRDGGVSGGTGGALVKVGTGTWTLSGTNTYTGGTTLELGTIVVANPQALGLGDVRVNGGVLRVGGSTGDIRVGGNYTQSGGELQLRIGGTGAGDFDRLQVVGQANLGGRLSLNTVNGYSPQTNDSIAFVTAGGGVQGTFDTVQTDAPLVDGRIDYFANEVVLSFVRTSFADVAQTPNQSAVANALDQSVFGPGGEELLQYLDTLPIEALPTAFDRLAPEEFGAMFSISRSAAVQQAFTVMNRLDQVRWASRNDMTSYEDPGDGKAVAAGPDDGKKNVLPEESPRLSVYATGGGEFVDIGDSSLARGYNFDAGGVTVGADYKVTNNFVAGFLVNYTRTRADLTRGGRIDADAVRGGVYASVFGAGGYLTAYAGGGYNHYDTKRDALRGKANGDTEGGEFNALIAAGYDARVGGLTIGPVATWQYTYTQVDSFSERGSIAPLDVRSQDSQSSRTNLGIRIAYDVPVGTAMLIPEVRATWQHEFGDRSYATTARFQFGGPDFSVATPEIGRDSFALDAGFTLQVSPYFGAHAYYHGNFGTDNFNAHNVYVGARMSF